MRIRTLAAIAFLMLAFHVAPVGAANSPDQAHYGALQWRMAGPSRGGRAIAVTGVPGSSTIFYFGAVGGGVWKSNDAGRTWHPIFDSQPVASIGAIAVAPSNSNVLYIGSGEADMRSDIIHGNGMYRSSDAGATWKRIGLTDTRQISRIVVDPSNADHLYVAALGHAYGPNAQRGVFESSDGGVNWKSILSKDNDTGAIDLTMDPQHPQTLYAALWQTRRPPWSIYPPSNGPGSGLYKSIDGGATWAQLHGGLPVAGLGRIGIAISPSQPQRVYAVVDANKGGVYRSDDGGTSWKLTDNDSRIWQRGWYFSNISVDPKNPDVVYVSDTCVYRSNDGGKSFVAIKGAPGGDDYHMLWIDPTDGDRMILGSDQGAIVSLNGAQTWSSWYNQPTAQIYHVATDNRFPYWIYGAQQDSGAIAVPSRSNHLGISARDWMPINAGGESNFAAPDPDHPGIIYGGTVDREDLNTLQDQDLSPELSHPANYRHEWTQPLVFNPRNSNVLYYSSNVLFRSGDRGKNWKIISGDQTRSNPGIPKTLDATTAKDRHGDARQGVIYTIAPSPVARGTIWTGTDDGNIWLTRNEGASWQNVTPAALSGWSKVGIIEASHSNPLVAYAAIDRHRLDDDRPYIYRTHDGGKSWTAITSGIPDGSFVNAIREDTRVPGLLFAGTETGVFISFDDGAQWKPLQLNLPTVSVRDLTIHGDDLIIATHGRSFWVLDNITPLRQLTQQTMPGLRLFTPQVAVRVRPGDDQGTPLPLDESQGANPPTGAVIDYYLAAPATPFSIDILDARGNLVRRFRSSALYPEARTDPKSVDIPPAWIHQPQEISTDPGMHRIAWDFHYGDKNGVLAPPGEYAVRMIAGTGRAGAPLHVVKDPRISASNADLVAQFTFAREVEALQTQASDAYKASVQLRKKLSNAKDQPSKRLLLQLDAVAGAPPPASPDDSIGAPETNLHSLHYLSVTLLALRDSIESADAAPTPNARQALTVYRSMLHDALTRYGALREAAMRLVHPS